VLSFIDQGAGSAVLFLHGFALDARMWQPQIDALRGRHRAIAVDLPGFGPKATRIADGVSAARALLGVLDALHVDRAHVVGHCLGGAVATDFALAFPHRVRTLVLVDALLRGRDPGIAAWNRCRDLARSGHASEAREAWVADPLFEASREHPDTAARLRDMAADYGCAHWSGEVSTTYESPDPPGARLAELRASTLVVAGERDLPTFAAMAEEYAATLPHARKIVIPGVGHVPSLEAAEAFNSCVGAFFAS
jgi:pimeloyl-ACP methyl ester carboxylesterase